MHEDPDELEFRQREQHLFEKLRSPTTQELYEKIMQLGKELPALAIELRTEENRVQGCQSLMYLQTRVQEGRLFLEVFSDALISKGLAAIAIQLYSGLPLATIVKCPCNLAKALQLESTLTPSRLGGFGSILQRIQREALMALIQEHKNA